MSNALIGLIGVVIGGIFTYVIGPYIQAHIVNDVCSIQRSRISQAHGMVSGVYEYVRNNADISKQNREELLGKASAAESFVRANMGYCK